MRRSFTAMFPAPRQKVIDDLVVPEPALAAMNHPVLLVHGFNDVYVPFGKTSLYLMHHLPKGERSSLRPVQPLDHDRAQGSLQSRHRRLPHARLNRAMSMTPPAIAAQLEAAWQKQAAPLKPFTETGAVQSADESYR